MPAVCKNIVGCLSFVSDLLCCWLVLPVSCAKMLLIRCFLSIYGPMFRVRLELG